MLERSFDELTTQEKLRLQSIERKAARNESLGEQEQELYDRFHERYEQELKKAKGRWPIIIGLILISLLAVARRCLG